MNKLYKLITIALLMFIFVTSVSAVAITTNSSVSGTVDPNSKLVTNTGTLTVTNAGGDTLKTYKVVDVFYNSTTNNVTYEFTTLFKAYLASTNGQSPDYHSLTVDQYMAMTGSSTSSGTVPTSSTTLDALMSGFAQYIRANDSTATATMTTSNGNATTTAAAGAYLILPSSTSDVYSVMVGNVKLVPGSNNTWDIEGTTINAKKSIPSITKYFYDYRNVECSGEFAEFAPIENPINGESGSGPGTDSYRFTPNSKTLAFNKYERFSLIASSSFWGTSGANCKYVASYNIGEEFDYIINATIPTYPPDSINRVLNIVDTFSTDNTITFKGLNYVTIKDGNTTLTIQNGNVKNGNTVVGTISYTAPSGNSTGELEVVFDPTLLTSNNISIQYTASLNNNAYAGHSNSNDAYLEYTNEPYKSNGGTIAIHDHAEVYTYGIGVWKYDSEYDPNDTVTYPDWPQEPNEMTICEEYNYPYSAWNGNDPYWQTADGIACRAAADAAMDNYWNTTYPAWLDEVAELAGIPIVEPVEESVCNNQPSCDTWNNPSCQAQYDEYYETEEGIACNAAWNEYRDYEGAVQNHWSAATNYGSNLTVSAPIGPYLLNGATFAIYANSTCTGTPLGTFTTTNQSGNDMFQNLDSYDGIGVYVGIKAGTYCVKETAAPAGYRLDSTPHVIQVGQGQTNSIAISNTKQGLLPSTGGVGSYLYIAIGALLVIGSIATIVIINKKKKDAE